MTASARVRMIREADWSSMAEPLTSADETRLADLIRVVHDGLDTFVAVGNALAEINEAKLYRATHKTFEQFVKDEFGISRSYAYRKMAAAKVAAVMSPIGDISNEAMARELTKVPSEKVVEVYKAAADRTGGKVTANAIETAARAFAFDEKKAVPPPRRPDRDWLQRVVPAVAGTGLAERSIEANGLDASVTPNEAAAWSADIDGAVRWLIKLRRVLNERAGEDPSRYPTEASLIDGITDRLMRAAQNSRRDVAREDIRKVVAGYWRRARTHRDPNAIYHKILKAEVLSKVADQSRGDQ